MFGQSFEYLLVVGACSINFLAQGLNSVCQKCNTFHTKSNRSKGAQIFSKLVCLSALHISHHLLFLKCCWYYAIEIPWKANYLWNIQILQSWVKSHEDRDPRKISRAGNTLNENKNRATLNTEDKPKHHSRGRDHPLCGHHWMCKGVNDNHGHIEQSVSANSKVALDSFEFCVYYRSNN